MSKETNFVTHLECSLTGTKYEKNKIHGLSEEGKPLFYTDFDILAKGKRPDNAKKNIKTILLNAETQMRNALRMKTIEEILDEM